MFKGYTIIGGSLSPPISITWEGGPPVTAEEIETQIKDSRQRNLPYVSEGSKTATGLAVVGGGPSVLDHLETLREWKNTIPGWNGEVWAINGAYGFLKRRGIASTFVAVDPHAIVARWAKEVDDNAIVAARCHASVFEALDENKANVRVFDLARDNPSGIATSSSTAGAAIHLAFRLGFASLTYFGCESSYVPGQTHSYMHEIRPAQLMVRCNGEEFLTAPDYLVQAIELAPLIRECPEFLKEQSGGLLAAMIASPSYDILWVSDDLAEQLRKKPDQPEDTRFDTPADMPVREVA